MYITGQVVLNNKGAIWRQKTMQLPRELRICGKEKDPGYLKKKTPVFKRQKRKTNKKEWTETFKKHTLGAVCVVKQVKPIPTTAPRENWFEFQLLYFWHRFSELPGKAQNMAQVFGSLLAMRETQLKCLSPGFHQAQSWMLQPFGGKNQQNEVLNGSL